MSQLRACTVFAIAGLVGCGGGGGGSISPEEFGDAIVDAVCERYARCGLVTSVAACRDLVQAADAQFIELVNAIEMGTIEYDGGLVADCIDAFASASCDETSESVRAEPDACADAIQGTVPDGG